MAILGKDKMIIYQLHEDSINGSVAHYDILEYPVIMENETGSDNTMPELPCSCIHTATLAVCTVLVIFVLFLGCTGNGVVLFNALTTKRLRNNFDLLVINLAGADFIMCTCLSPIFLFLLFSDSAIPKVFCGSILFLGVTSGMLSLLSLVVIAGHRMCRVVGYVRRPLSLCQTSGIVSLIWLISISLALGGTLHVTSIWQEEAINECNNVVNNGASLTSNFVLYFLSPATLISLTTIAACYLIVARVVGRPGTCQHDPSTYRDNECCDEPHCDRLTYEPHNLTGLIADKYSATVGKPLPGRGGRAVTMCVVVTSTVTLCWAPLVISQFIELFTGDSIILYQVKLCGIALIFLNSALDPYIYGQTNTRIQHRYARFLYNFTFCDLPLQQTHKRRRTDRRTTEGCCVFRYPPALTQDTNTVLLCCPQCESLCEEGAAIRKSQTCYHGYGQQVINCPQTHLAETVES